MNSLLFLFDLKLFLSNNWYYVLALLLSAIAIYINNRKKSASTKEQELIHNNKISTEISPNISPIISPIFNINTLQGLPIERTDVDKQSDNDNKLALELKLETIKARVKILFIDDDKKFNIVKILKESGWRNTSSVTDIKTLDQAIVREADILFVDINGVGLALNCIHGGLDVALMLKQKYENKKVGIYSANKTTNAFHPAWDIIDFKLEKNALPLQFEQLIENCSLELYG